MWETFALFSLIDQPVFILKRELTWIPFFGWYLLKTGMIGIDRKAGIRSLKMLIRMTREEMRLGRQLVIFPGRHATSDRSPASLQERRRHDLCRRRRAVYSGGPQLRSVLAAPDVPALSRNALWLNSSIRCHRDCGAMNSSRA